MRFPFSGHDVVSQFQHTTEQTPSIGQVFLYDLLASSLVLTEDWDRLSGNTQEELLRCSDKDHILELLVEHGLLTMYQAHTIMGADTLQQVAQQHGFALSFLQMAREIARSHHERYDGTGYPDRLSGSDIPLSARLVAVCDVYDALRSRRTYKPALSHIAAVQMMTETSPGQFDPALLPVFVGCAPEFEKIYKEFRD